MRLAPDKELVGEQEYTPRFQSSRVPALGDEPGRAGDVTRHQRRVTRDSDSVGHVHEGCVRRTRNVCQHRLQSRHKGDVFGGE
jgi:hypothetical protein